MGTSKLVLDIKARESILKHVTDTYPNEALGFMYGYDTEDERNILEVEPIETTSSVFDLTPMDYVNAEEYAEVKGMSLLGVYLSHPDHQAIPSATHLRHALPFYSYLIVPVKRGEPGTELSWKIQYGRFVEEDLHFANTVPDMTELFGLTRFG